MRGTWRDVILSCGLALLGGIGTPPIAAQDWSGQASVEVEVADYRGRALAGASVTLRFAEDPGAGGPEAVTTDKKGRATVSGLAAGRWQLEVTAPGFMVYRAELALSRDQRPVIDFAAQHNVPGAVAPLRVKVAHARAVTGRQIEVPDIRRLEPKKAGERLAPAEPPPAPVVAAAPAPTPAPPPAVAPPSAPTGTPTPAPAPAVAATPAPAPPAMPGPEPAPTAPVVPPTRPAVVPTPAPAPAAPVPVPPAAGPTPAPSVPTPTAAPSAAAPTPPTAVPKPAPPAVAATPKAAAPTPAPAPPAPAVAPAAAPAPPTVATAPKPVAPAPMPAPPAPAPQLPKPAAPPASPAAPTPAPAIAMPATPPAAAAPAPAPPVLAPPPAVPARPAPPVRAVQSLPRSRSVAAGNCAECKPGQAAVTVELQVPAAPSGSEGCPADIAERLQEKNDAAFEVALAQLPASCGVASIRLAAGSKPIAETYEARAGDRLATCSPGEACPSSGSRWPVAAVVRRSDRGTRVLAPFENLSGGPRTGVLTVVLEVADRD